MAEPLSPGGVADVVEEYVQIETEHTQYAQRQRELAVKASAGVATDAEVDELVRLDRRLPGIEQRLQDAEAQLAKHKSEGAINALVARWGDAEKRALYVQLVADIRRVQQGIVAIRQFTRQQNYHYAQVPMRADDRPFEMSEDALVKNLVHHQVTPTLEVPLVEDLYDNDRGCKPLTRRTFYKYLGADAWKT